MGFTDMVDDLIPESSVCTVTYTKVYRTCNCHEEKHKSHRNATQGYSPRIKKSPRRRIRSPPSTPKISQFFKKAKKTTEPIFADPSIFNNSPTVYATVPTPTKIDKETKVWLESALWGTRKIEGPESSKSDPGDLWECTDGCWTLVGRQVT